VREEEIGFELGVKCARALSQHHHIHIPEAKRGQRTVEIEFPPKHHLADLILEERILLLVPLPVPEDEAARANRPLIPKICIHTLHTFSAF
jgi:hypothetical protein